MIPLRRYCLTWPAAFVFLLLLITPATSAPANTNAAPAKKKRRKRTSSEPEGVSDKVMPESDNFEEIEASNFMRKVFRKDQDVLLLMYGSQERNSVGLHTVAEAAARFVKSSKAARHFRCARIDELRFGVDLYTGKNKNALDSFKGPFPKMFLVRASEKLPLRIPGKDLQSDMYIVKFLVEQSSFRHDFGFHEWAKSDKEKKIEKHGTDKGVGDADHMLNRKSVPRSKYFKELTDDDIREQVFRSDSDVVLVIYRENHKKSQKQWKHFEAAASTLTEKELTGNLAFGRLDQGRYGVGSLPIVFRKERSLPRLYYVRAANNTIHTMDSNTIDWYRENGILEFIAKYVSGDMAWDYAHKKDAPPQHEEL